MAMFIMVWILISTVTNNIFSQEELEFNTTEYCSYSENGVPLVTKEFEQFFNQNQFDFAPNYQVVYETNALEEGVYITLSELRNDLKFLFYEARYPQDKCYKINFPLKIERCQNPQNCKQLQKCDQGSIQATNKTASAKVVYVSWKTLDTVLTIFVQYKNEFLRCLDASPSWKIKKLVMSTDETQKINVKKAKFYSGTKLNSLNSNTFKWDLDKVVYLQVLRCFNYSFISAINCNGTRYADNITKTNFVILNKQFRMEPWVDIQFEAPKNLTNNNCFLQIDSNFSLIYGGFFNIPRVLELPPPILSSTLRPDCTTSPISEVEEMTTSVAVTTTSPLSTTIKEISEKGSTNTNIVWIALPWVLLCVVLIGIIIMWFKLRPKRQALRVSYRTTVQTADTEILVPLHILQSGES